MFYIKAVCMVKTTQNVDFSGDITLDVELGWTLVTPQASIKKVSRVRYFVGYRE